MSRLTKKYVEARISRLNKIMGYGKHCGCYMLGNAYEAYKLYFDDPVDGEIDITYGFQSLSIVDASVTAIMNHEYHKQNLE